MALGFTVDMLQKHVELHSSFALPGQLKTARFAVLQDRLQLILLHCFFPFLRIRSVCDVGSWPTVAYKHKNVLFLYSVQYQELLTHERVGKTGTAILRKTNLYNADFGN